MAAARYRILRNLSSSLGRSLSSRPQLQRQSKTPLVSSLHFANSDGPVVGRLWAGGFAWVSISRAYSSSPGDGSGNGGEWFETVRAGWDGIREKTGELREAFIAPYVNELMDSHPYLNEIVSPAAYTLVATGLVWFVMPGIFKRLHVYATRTKILPEVIDVPYEKSFWGALEAPVRYLVTVFAFSQLGILVAPSIVVQYLEQVWRGAAIISLIWFLHRWKTNWINSVLSSPRLVAIDREKILTIDNITSVGLFALGLMALAEACGIAVQSILTVGGIGGVATAFASKDILGNFLSGLSIQMSQPFSIGDTIKAGSIEGQVMKVGLTSTLLLSTEKFPVVVPNALFSSQAIVNKSRAEWRAIIAKVPLTLESIDLVPKISGDIKSMLDSYQTNLLIDDPHCFLSAIENAYAELTIAYNLKHMSKGKQYSVRQDILLQAVNIAKQNGGDLIQSYQSSNVPLS